MEKIVFKTTEELKKLLCQNFTEQGCILTTKSAAKCNKKSRETKEPYESVFSNEIICITTRPVIVGASYKDLLKRYSPKDETSEAAEGTTESLELPWGEWVNGSNSLIFHKDTYYLRVYSVEKGSDKKYLYVDNNSIEEEKLKRLDEFLPPKKEEEQKVLVNNIKLDSIVSMHFNDLKIEKE